MEKEEGEEEKEGKRGERKKRVERKIENESRVRGSERRTRRNDIEGRPSFYSCFYLSSSSSFICTLMSQCDLHAMVGFTTLIGEKDV